MKKYEYKIIEEDEMISNEQLSIITGGKLPEGGWCWCLINQGNHLECEKKEHKLELFTFEKGSVFCMINTVCAK